MKVDFPLEDWTKNDYKFQQQLESSNWNMSVVLKGVSLNQRQREIGNESDQGLLYADCRRVWRAIVSMWLQKVINQVDVELWDKK